MGRVGAASEACTSEESIAMVSSACSNSGNTIDPSDSCLKIRFTAITPAAPVNAAKSAPTYPGVTFAKDVKSKLPSSLSFEHKTFKILDR